MRFAPVALLRQGNLPVTLYSWLVAGASVATTVLIALIAALLLRSRRRLAAVRLAHPDAITFVASDGGGLASQLRANDWVRDPGTGLPGDFVVAVTRESLSIWRDDMRNIASVPAGGVATFSSATRVVGRVEASCVVATVLSGETTVDLWFVLVGGSGQVVPAVREVEARILASTLSAAAAR
jgi:hypothetical protein